MGRIVCACVCVKKGKRGKGILGGFSPLHKHATTQGSVQA